MNIVSDDDGHDGDQIVYPANVRIDREAFLLRRDDQGSSSDELHSAGLI